MHKSKLYLSVLMAFLIMSQMAYAQDAGKGDLVKAAEKPQTTSAPALSGTAALMDAVDKGLLKRAGQEDIQQYFIAKAKAMGLPDHIINNDLLTGSYSTRRTYVVLSPDFVIPYGLADVDYDGAVFVLSRMHHAGIELIVPKGIPEPKGPRGFCQVISYEQIEASVQNEEQLAESCKFPNLPEKLPSNTKVYVLGIGGPDKSPELEASIDAGKEGSRLKEVTVNSPSEPAVLLLHGSEPNLWHFSWTEGTKILAVYASGNYTQAVSGLPKDVPVFYNKTTSGDSPCPIFKFDSFTSLKDTVWHNINLKGLARHNALSKHLFNKNFDYLEDTNSGKIVLGEPLAENSKLESAGPPEVEKFRVSNQAAKPEVDEAGLRATLLREALAKGLIRKATEEDRHQYILAGAKADGLSDDTIKNYIEPDIDNVRRYFSASYVILSSDFVSGDWLYNEHMRGSFIAPAGIRVPQKENSYITVYSYDELKEAGARKKPIAETCKFSVPLASLPPNAKVYALSDSSGTDLDFQIEGSAKPAMLMEVRINSPSEPVFLLLSAHNPAIWHFSWTKGTKIAAVYISSRHKQIISGLPDGVPLLINNVEEQLSACPPLEMSAAYDKLVANNDLSRHLFNRNIEAVYFPGRNRPAVTVLGQPLTGDSPFESAQELDVKKYRAPATLLTGKVGLNEAVDKGLIRVADNEDMRAYKIAEAKAKGVPDNLIKNNLKTSENYYDRYYVVLSPDFIIPENTRAAFYVPEGMPKPKGPCEAPAHRSSACKIYSYDDLKIQASKRAIPETCKFSNSPGGFPAKAKVYAIGRKTAGTLGAMLDFYIDDHNMNRPYLMKITVNSPSEPVILMLETIDSTIWHFNWTKGTKIAAVYIEGYGRQVASGLPSDVPVLIDKRSTNKNESSLCPGFSASEYAGSLGAANDLSRHLFNRDIFQMHELSAEEFVIGQPLEPGSKLESAEALNPAKFRDPKVPLPGQAGLEEAVSKGLIRKAEEREVQEYLEARAKAEGLPGHIIKDGFNTDDYAIHQNPYIVLSSDFVIPEHLYENNSASFIVPPGLKEPESPRASGGKAPFFRPQRQYGAGGMITEMVASRIYSYEDLKSLSSDVYSYEDLKYMGKNYFNKSDVCIFPNTADLPAKAKVYAVNADAGTGLDFNIEGSAKPARLMRVTVNSPSEPALLILKADSPTIWHFNWTRGSKIAGVFISGDGPQLASGLSKNVPLMINGQDPASSCTKIEVSSSLIDLVVVNNLSRQLFKRSIEKTGKAEDGKIVIGRPLTDGSRLESAEEFDIKKFRDPHTPPAGQAGLDYAAAKNLIRSAGSEDIEKYKVAKSEAEIEVRTELEKLPRHLIVKMGYGRLQDVKMPKPYVVLSPDFVIPAGLTGDEAASFIIPDGLPDPKGPIGDCRFFRYATMAQERKKELESRTWGAGCIIHHDYPVSVPKFPASCSLPRPVSPDKVYVIGASPQHKLDFQIDDSGEQAHLMKLTVNAPNESAALFLKTDKPTIWHFSWTKDTQISAVIISGGKYKQAVSGLPEDVPVLFGQGNGYDLSLCPPNFEVELRFPDKVRKINGLSQHFFKRDIDSFSEATSLNDDPSQLLIGQPLSEGSRIESAEEFKLEKFKDPAKPLAGKAGLNDAVAKGLIRVATKEDMDEYLAVRNKAGGLTEEAAFKAKQVDLAAATRDGKLGCRRNFAWGSGPITDTRSIYNDAYVVLSPDFVIPLSVNFPKFIVPKDMPVPKGSPGCGMIFSYDELRPIAE